MFYYRRKVLLAILEIFDGQLTAKSLQKYLFLFTEKQKTKTFDFVPYKYGCFSFQANQDIGTLCKYGYIEITNTDTGRYIRLNRSDNYSASLNSADNRYLTEIRDEFGNLSQMELIRYTYINYPFYAIKSSIAAQILTADELVKVNAQRCTFTEPVLFTIGYEGISLEVYINRLILNDIRTLCDVRRNAYSQKYGFSKVQLQQACAGVGIEYIHIPELGIATENRQNLSSQKEYEVLFENYERTTLKNSEKYLNIILDKLREKGRVALTCFEKEAAQCHRERIAKHLMGIPNRRFSLKNL